MSNAKVLLDRRFDEEKKNLPKGLSLGQQFELFSANIILKDHDLSYSELETGMTGGSEDGGVDAFYLFVNGTLIAEEEDFVKISSGIEIRLVLIQSKHEDKTKEAVIDRLLQHIDWILDLEPDESELKLHFNSDMLFKLSLFRSAMERYGTKQYELFIDIYYCSRGPEPVVKAQALAEKLAKRCISIFSGAVANFHFAGADELHRLTTQVPFQKRHLKPVAGGVISASKDSFVALISLKEYLSFLTESGSLLQSLFEFNVRDYEGEKKTVNAEMADTINDYQGSEDFWWFNNGVTIISNKADYKSGQISVERPMIVNGLQTSTTIFENRKTILENVNDDRSILVRIVQVEDSEIQEKVIKATNSQTSLKPLALKATDKLQRDIEEYLLHHGIFYERRKNFYKNRGKPARSIIDVSRLGQAVMSLRLQVPDQARGRVGSYLKLGKNYDKVFLKNVDFNEYVVAAKLAQSVDEFLVRNRLNYDAIYRNNLRFHTIMVCGWKLAGKKKKFNIAKLRTDKITDQFVIGVFEWLQAKFDESGGADATSKDADFTKQLVDEWEPSLTK